MIDIEVCINSDKFNTLYQSVTAAYNGGAASVELCSAMQLEGLTPEQDQIEQARSAFKKRKGLMVMIRPRQGDFFYSQRELQVMLAQIEMAATAGADGVVFGMLNNDTHLVEHHYLRELVNACQKLKLVTTFHRAIDAAADYDESLQILIAEGVDRVLTNGTAWGSQQPAVYGINRLKKAINTVSGKIQFVIGGGVNLSNAQKIVQCLPFDKTRIYLHTYSAVLRQGVTDTQRVSSLFNTANSECLMQVKD